MFANQREERREPEQESVRVRRNHDLLEHELDHVGEGLRAALEERQIDAIRALPRLHPADHLALGERVERHAEDQRDHDHDRLHQRQERKGPVRRDQAGQPVAQRGPIPHQITVRVMRPSFVLDNGSEPRTSASV
jgi:hypothetical protein